MDKQNKAKKRISVKPIVLYVIIGISGILGGMIYQYKSMEREDMLKNIVIEEINEIVENSVNILKSELAGVDENSNLEEALFSKLEWEVSDIEIEKDTCQFTLTAKNINFYSAIAQYEKIIFEELIESEGEIEDSFAPLIDCINEQEVEENKKTIKMQKNDQDQYEVINEEELLNMLLPGLMEI